MAKNNASSLKTLKRLLRYAVPYRALFYLALLFSLFGVAATIVAPYLIGNAIDLMNGDIDFSGVTRIAAILAVIYTLSAAFAWLATIFMTMLSQRVIKAMRIDFIKTLHSVPLSYIDKSSRGDLVSRIINDLDTVAHGLLQGLIQLFSGVATVLFIIVMMFYLNVYIALAIVLVTPVSIFVSYFIAKRAQRLFRLQQSALGELNGIAEEMVGSFKQVKAYTYEEQSYLRFDNINKRYMDAYKNAHFNSALVNPTTRFINNSIYIMTGLMGIALGASIGSIGSFLMYANQFTRPFNEISTVIAELQSAIASADRVFEILDEQSGERDSLGAVSLNSAKGDIIFDSVDFSYNPEVRLIKNFNLLVKKGEKIAIVGPTGAGKTTLVNLLMRFYEVDSGKILLDGLDITDIKRRDMRQNYGMVLQNSWLYSASIKDNITYGRSDASLQKVIEVAKKCHSHEFISAMERGYDTIVSDSGSNMSAGERQLICIARVMITNPSILILDEATSNIDTRTERHIQDAFDTMMKGRTSFIIAHRLSTIKSADKILVLKDGDIIETGAHNELLEKQGFYYELYNSQFSG
ncbi:MAG: ABC transporter ATP-binding protein [Clostridia bacterium]